MTGQTHGASRFIKASPEAVYAAFVDAEVVRRWLPPRGATAKIGAFEPWAGGRFSLTLTLAQATGKTSPDTDVVEGRFVALSPPRRIVQSFDFISDDPAFAGTMTMSWTIAPVSGGVDVEVEAANVPLGIGRADHEQAMASTLANLAIEVE